MSNVLVYSLVHLSHGRNIVLLLVVDVVVNFNLLIIVKKNGLQRIDNWKCQVCD